jgi:hypothetical protein
MFQVYEKKKAVRWRYDVGRKKNFEQVRPSWMCPLESLLSLLCMDTQKWEELLGIDDFKLLPGR